jgi:hypothetical protein
MEANPICSTIGCKATACPQRIFLEQATREITTTTWKELLGQGLKVHLDLTLRWESPNCHRNWASRQLVLSHAFAIYNFQKRNS